MTAPKFPHLPAEAWELFLREELEAAAAARLEVHLAECEACQAILETEEPAFLFRRLRDQAAPDGTWDGFWEELQPRLGARPRPRHAWSRPALAGAAAVLAVVMLAVVMQPGDDRRGEPLADGTTRTADPCPAAVASLRLTPDECRALFGGPIEGTQPPQIVLSESMDLRGL